MKQLLLAIAFLTSSTSFLFAQNCGFPAANFCEEAKFICGSELEGYFGNNAGYQPAPDIPGFGVCGSFHNPQFFQIVPCSEQISLTVTALNCLKGDGLQVALADSCDGQIIACDGGDLGDANVPLFLSTDVTPGEPYVLIIDGYLGDECEFIIHDLQGIDTNPPGSDSLVQQGYIEFQSLPCGPATLTAHLPICYSEISPGCQSSWAEFYSENCLGIEWNLPPGVQIISPDPNAFTITVQFTQQVTNGMVSVNLLHTCPGIDLNECAECIPFCFDGLIPPIFISSPGSSYTYVPCEEAPVYCTGSLDLVTFNNGCSFAGFGWWQTAQWGLGDPLCFSLESPNLYRVIACEGLSNLSFEVSNCENARGLEFALLQGGGCDELYPSGNCITLLEGQSGQFSTPFYYSPFEEFYIIVDGIDLDACDFKITEILNGGNNNGQSNCLASPPIIDNFAPLPYYSVSFGVTHSDETFVTGGPGSYQNGFFTSAPIPCGTPYSFEVKTGGCTQIISGNSPCYLPPDCQNFNLPAPLADSCHLAPYFSGGCLDGYCGTNAGLTPDQPIAADDTIPVFENNGWLRISPCEDSIAIDFQVFDCQNGDELGFFLLSGDCDSMTLISFISAKDGNVAQLTASGLAPGEVYFLAVDGFYNAECKFQAHVLEGLGIEPDTAICSNCTPSVIDGPSDLCPGDFATYTLSPGGCDITFFGGNGELCTPSGVCQLQPDTLELHWVIPPFMNFVGDSVGVFSITVQVDTNLIGIDTVLTGQVNAFWAPAPGSGGGGNGGGGGGGNLFDDKEFCGCTYVIGPCVSPIIPLDVTVHHDVEIDYCELTCAQPCCSHEGQSYCAPGEYIVSQTNCLTKKLIVTDAADSPFADAGPTGYINCINQSATLIGNSSYGPNFTYAWSGPGLPGFNQNQQNITVVLPGTYTLVVTNTSNGCTASDNTVVVMDITPPTISIPPVPKVCYGFDATLTANANPSFAQYNWSNNMTGQLITFPINATSTYTVTVTNPANGCTSTATATVQVLPPKVTNLPPKTICEGDCVYVHGEEFCSAGSFTVVAESYLGCDSLIVFSIIVKPYVVTNHGTIGTLTCNTPSVSFMGNTYNQPGTYSVYIMLNPGGCTEHQFTIAENIVPPFVEAGQPQEICDGQTATLAVSPVLPGVEYIWGNGVAGPQISVSPTTTTTYTVVAQNLDNGCGAVDQVTVTVNPAADTDLGVMGTLNCAQPQISILGNTYDQPGQYSVPKPNGCGNNTFIIMADITPPWCPILPVPAVCAGESVTLQTAPPFPSNLQYLWSTGETTQEITVTPLVTTNYTVTATDPANGCSSVVTTEVEVNQPQTIQLGQVGVLTCAQPCFTYNGQEYCQPGTYTFKENCEIKEFQIGEDLSLPTVQLGQVGVLTCSQSCFTFNGVEYCQPGTYSITENCEIKEFQIGEDLSLPTVQLGQVGTLTCSQPCFTFNGQEYCQPGTYSFTENCEVKEFQIGEDLSLPTVQLGQVGTLTCSQPCFTFNGVEYCQPGTYSFTENCEIKEFQIGEDLSLPTVQLGQVGTLTCSQPCFTFNGQEYCQPGTYSFTENCEIKEFQIGEDLSLPTVQLGLVGVLTCSQSCFTFNGVEYCQPGTYSFTENCEIKEFQIGEDLSLPTVQLGQVGTLTCSQPCFTFNGQEYCQPGTYSFTENCELKEFQIGEDLSLPTIQLGQVGTLTCSQPCFTFNGQEYCQPGTYSFTENCEIKEFQIGDLPAVWLELGEDQTITAGEFAELKAQTNAQPVVISWQNSTGVMPENSFDITVQPLENTLYSLKIQDTNGCLLEDSVWVLVKKADGAWYVPNVIRPASSDLNGWFTLFASPNYVAEIQQLEIFDRWGNLVFARKNFPPNAPEMGWDGTQSGKMLDPAVFVWHAVLVLNDGSTEQVRGDVTVLR